MSFDRRGVFGGREDGSEGATPRVPKARWEYRDQHDNIQGPFTDAQMWEWHSGSFFNENLPIRTTADDAFFKLGKLEAEAPAGSDFFQSYGAQRGADPGSEGGRHWQSDAKRGRVLDALVISRTESDLGPRSCGIINQHSPIANGVSKIGITDRSASTGDLQAFDKSAQQQAPVVRRSRLGAWTVGSDETAGGAREQQQAQPQPQQQQQQQQQPRARKSVLASLREGKSLVDPPAPANLTSFFDPSVETPAELVELEPEKPSSNKPAWQQQRSNGVAAPVRPPQQQVPPQSHQDQLRQQQMAQQAREAQQRNGADRRSQMMHADDFEQRLLAGAGPSNASHTPQQQRQQHRGAIGIPAKPSANGGVRMPQMPGGDWSEAPAPLVHAPVGQVTGQESQRNVIGESAKEPVWGAQQAVQPKSIREIQQKQQVVERERQAKIQMQQANKPSASGWANKPAAAPSMRDIMAQEQHATGKKSVQVPADPVVAPEPDELNMFWSYQSDAPAPAPSVPARATVSAPTPAVQKAPAPASRANEDFPALGAPIQASGSNGVSHGKGVAAPKVQASTMVAAISGPMANGKGSMQAGQAHQNQWSASKADFPSLGGQGKGKGSQHQPVPDARGKGAGKSWKQDTPPPSTAPAGDIKHLEKWCKMELEKFNLKDLSFVYLLCSLTNPTDLRSHLTQRLGTSVATERFAEDFIRMRTQGSSGFQNSSRSQAPVEQVQAPAARGKKKKKGGKASKVDASFLGFGVSANGRLLEDGQTL